MAIVMTRPESAVVLPLAEALDLGPTTWDRLLAGSRAAGPFLTWAWHRACAEAAGGELAASRAVAQVIYSARALEDIERAGPRIFGVHLNDAVEGDDHHNRLPGEGELPLAEIVRAIEATGYRGTYDNEYMDDPSAAPAPEAVVKRCAEAMAAVLEEAGIAPATAR